MTHLKPWQKIILTVLPICIGLCIAAAFIPFRTALVFHQGKTNEMTAFLPLKKGETFQVIWKHSIHLTDVIEKYKIQKNSDMKQYEIVYEHFGIGMPSYALQGEKMTYENGEYHIRNLHNIFPEINMRNGKTVSKHRLVWGNHAQHIIWFNQYLQPGVWYKLRVEKLSLWTYLKGVKIHE